MRCFAPFVLLKGGDSCEAAQGPKPLLMNLLCRRLRQGAEGHLFAYSGKTEYTNTLGERNCTPGVPAKPALWGEEERRSERGPTLASGRASAARDDEVYNCA